MGNKRSEVDVNKIGKIGNNKTAKIIEKKN